MENEPKQDMERYSYIELTGNEFADQFGFRIRVTTKESHYVNIEVEDITAWSMDGQPREWEPYLKAYMKWDNCNHFWFGDGDNDGYLHICGNDSMERHIKLMVFLYDHAMTLMGREHFLPLGVTVEAITQG